MGSDKQVVSVVFPACAGVILILRLLIWQNTCFPRMCGGDPFIYQPIGCNFVGCLNEEDGNYVYYWDSEDEFGVGDVWMLLSRAWRVCN